ncbi:MAG TPA: magnesium transporter, partial [Phycisphaerales bacterium]|nr:magnesium transporter [Phycisphaerales bacterium]
DLLKIRGIWGGEELRSMPLFKRAHRRLSWLTINIVLNLVSATAISMFEGTLQQVIALAVFLPIISDMSGCSGNQAVAVSLRELTIGVIRPRDLMRVWSKEVSIGIINGIAVGILLAFVAFVWKSNPWLGGVVGVALAVNTVIAVSVGGLLPLVLKSLRMDPALSSAPILTTVTDFCGFFLALSIAHLMLPYISTAT